MRRTQHRLSRTAKLVPRPALLRSGRLVAEGRLAELGLQPSGWFVGWAAAGWDPSRMGIGPVPAVERLFARTGLDWRDVGLIELNEAFAPQVLAVLKEWRSEEHTSELQSLMRISYAVFCLKKKNTKTKTSHIYW